jgi:hypothetical protein
MREKCSPVTEYESLEEELDFGRVESLEPTMVPIDSFLH